MRPQTCSSSLALCALVWRAFADMITAPPSIPSVQPLRKRLEGSFIGYTNELGSYYASGWCSETATFSIGDPFGGCCPTTATNGCSPYTKCVGGSVLEGVYYTSTCRGNCVTNLWYASPGAGSAVSNIACAWDSDSATTWYGTVADVSAVATGDIGTTTDGSGTSAIFTTITERTTLTFDRSTTQTPNPTAVSGPPTDGSSGAASSTDSQADTTVTVSPQSATSSASPTASSGGSSSKAWIAGAVIGPVVGIALIGGLFLWALRLRKRNNNPQPQAPPPGPLPSSQPVAQAPGYDPRYSAYYATQAKPGFVPTPVGSPPAQGYGPSPMGSPPPPQFAPQPVHSPPPGPPGQPYWQGYNQSPTVPVQAYQSPQPGQWAPSGGHPGYHAS